MQPGKSGTSATKQSSSSLQEMTMSYWLFIVWLNPVFAEKNSNLFGLVCLGQCTTGLKIKYLFRPVSPENMV